MLNRIKELSELLNAAARAYYRDARPIMSDYEYDKLYDELAALETAAGFVLANSPTRRVGYPVLTSLSKVTHEHKLLSLDKTKDTEKLKTFLGHHTGLLSWKLDGLTIVLHYADGVLRQAVTRGNGEIGEDITHNTRAFRNIPARVNFPGRLILRGEAIIFNSDFEKINESLPINEQYKNPRNLCSGTVRQLNSEAVADRTVTFFAFALILAEKDGAPVEFGGEKLDRLRWLAGLGFDVVETRAVTAENVTEAVEYFKNKLPDCDFGSDGLVLTFNSMEYSASLGATSRFPRDSIAFKWADETAVTVLKGIQWNTSRTGLINPVAVFEPVELEGTTVNKAALHNVNVMEGLKLGIGDEITVYKANMIIPQIIDNLTRSDSCEIPARCPVCQAETEIVEQNDSKALYCTNPNCRAQLARGLAHYVSRDAMNIEGFSEMTIEKFIETGWLQNYTDIYSLARHEAEIQAMEGFGKKSCGRLLAAIEKSRTVTLSNFIFALGIHHVGLANAKLLCRYYSYDLEKIKRAQEDELLGIDGFGDVIAHSLTVYFADETNTALIDKAASLLTFENPPEESAAERPLDGLTFVITGDLKRFENRKELQNFIESLGGKATTAVSPKTSFLINNNPASTSAKNKKARELGVPVITEDELLEKIGK